MTARLLGFEWLQSPRGEICHLDDLAHAFDDLDVVVEVPDLPDGRHVAIGDEAWRSVDLEQLAREAARRLRGVRGADLSRAAQRLLASADGRYRPLSIEQVVAAASAADSEDVGVAVEA